MCEFKSLREERMMGGIAEGWFASNFVELFIYRSRFWRFYSPKRISCFDEGLRSGGIGFILGAIHKVRHARACFKKNSSLRIWPKISERPFLGILPQNLQFLSVENSDD